MAEKRKETEKVDEVKPVTEEYEDVFIPAPKGDTERYIACNGERILVQTNRTVRLPKRFAEIVKNSQQQDREAQAYIDAMMSK